MTSDWDKAEALVVCFRNLKGPRSKDLLLTARALQYLKNLPEFGSNQSVGDAVGVSGEIVRQFVGLLDLPSCIQDYLSSGALGLEHGRRLGQLSKSRPEILGNAAEAMTKLTAMEARDLCEHLIRNPMSSVDQSLDALAAAKQTVRKEYRISVILDEEPYRLLTSQARERHMRTSELATAMVIEWLERHNNV